jgi:hypothetical protein
MGEITMTEIVLFLWLMFFLACMFSIDWSHPKGGE